MVAEAPTNGHAPVDTLHKADTPGDMTDEQWFGALGSTGYLQFGGFPQDEQLPELRHPQSMRVYREMSDNDPVIGGFLNAADLGLRRAERIVKPADESPQALEAADICEQSLDDMRAGLDTWADRQSSFLSCVPFGFSCNEIVLKRCEGPRALQPSKYDDGKIRVDHLPIRAQETITQFFLDQQNPYVVQQAIGHPVTNIPYEKLLHFRTRSQRESPLGYSLLRRAYPSWYRIKVLQWIETVGIERDAAGIPVVKMPLADLIGTTDRNVATRDALNGAARNLRRNEAEGISIASDVDPDSKMPLYSIELLKSAGPRQIEIGATITRYEQRILMSVLADFLMLGHEGVGSLGLTVGVAKIDLFLASLETIGEQIASQMNRLFQLLTVLNGLPYQAAPTFEYGPLNKADLPEIAKTLLTLSQAGIVVGGDNTLRDWTLSQMGVAYDEDTPAPVLPVTAPPLDTAA